MDIKKVLVIRNKNEIFFSLTRFYCQRLDLSIYLQSIRYVNKIRIGQTTFTPNGR